jgi:hypothetical protein
VVPITVLKQYNTGSTAWEAVIVGGPGPQGPTGATGSTGSAGAPGQGVPTGGTTAQGLTKTSGTDYATAWTNIVANVQGVTGIWTGTQAAYDAIGTKTSTVLYVITP